MGWFGRKNAVPAGRAFVPAFLQGDEGSGVFARGYAAQLDEVHRRNPVGQRSVRLVAGMAGGLPIYAGEGQDEAVRLVTREPIVRSLTRPLPASAKRCRRMSISG